MFSPSLCVLADYVDSSVRTVTVNGYTYKFWSRISRRYFSEGDYSSSLTIGTYLTTVDNEFVPIGYMGAQSRLYSEDGELLQSSKWIYNNNSTSVIIDSFTIFDPVSYYYSKGQVKSYYGNGYSIYSCYRPPNFSTQVLSFSVSSDDIEVTRNVSGEIYGSEIFLNQLGIEPDLILAEGVGGFDFVV